MLMKHFALLFSLVISSCSLFAQNPGMAINTTALPADPSAMLDVSSNQSGMLVPRMSTTERDAISAPAEGLFIFNTDSKCFNVFKNSAWFEWCGNCIAPAVPVVSSNSPVCAGEDIQFFATSSPDATYMWSGPDGFYSSDQNPVIQGASGIHAGTYTVVASLDGCNSSSALESIVIVPIPEIANAGPDQLNVSGNSTSLAANAAVLGAGSWSIISGSGGTISSPFSATSTFSGNTGVTYVLRWTIANDCGTSSDDVSISFTAGGPKRVFVSSTTYNGNLGGIAGANSKCQSRADAASLGGTWKAWISTSTSSPSTTFTQSAFPYSMVNGTQIASNWNDLTDGSINTTINLNEFGNVVPFNGAGSYPTCGSWLGGYFIMSWNATKPDGTFAPVNPGYPQCNTTCSDWTGTSGGGDIWIQWNNSNTASCADALYRLLCFEQ